MTPIKFTLCGNAPSTFVMVALLGACGSSIGSGARGDDGGGGMAGGGSGGTSSGSGGGSGGVAAVGGQTGGGPFPGTAIFYQDVSKAPVDAESATIMAALAASPTAWSKGLGIDVSFTILTAAPDVPRRSFTSSGDEPDCDTGPVPLPAGGNIEGYSNYTCKSGGDCHLLVYQGKRLYELYQANVTSGLATGGAFGGSCLVIWDLSRDYWQPVAPPNYGRGDHCNGADAADLPMAPLILTSADIKSGKITHAMRFTLPSPAYIRKDVYVHPATHVAGGTGDDTTLPFGARLRLRGDYDLSKLPSEEARVVARALQTYGMFLADGGSIFISAAVGVEDAIETSALRTLKASDFEMIDGGPRLRWRDYQCGRTVVTD